MKANEIYNEKSYSKIGYIPKGETINHTWRACGVDRFIKNTDFVLCKSEVKEISNEARKVRVTLTLSVEDI